MDRLRFLFLGAGLVLAAFARDEAPSPPRDIHRYVTSFQRSERPLSEGGRWLGGQSSGHDWADVASAGGLAYGLESGLTGFDDATALLAGNWGPDQSAEATVHSANPSGKVWEEVELRLRSTLSPHWCTGYEINFRCFKAPGAYSDIVRWDGPLASFTVLSNLEGPRCGVKEGDVVRATMIGNKISVYLNGSLIGEAWDRTYASGNPGIGFYLQAGTGLNKDYGFTSFAATDAP